MSSTYSTSLRIQLITTGTEDEAWGSPTDNNFGTIIEQAITGVESVSLTNVSTYTLSTANASPDQARNAVLVFTGTPTANCNVVAPSVEKVYIVKNSTSGGYNVNIKTSGGNAVVVPANTSRVVYCDSVNFNTAVDVNNISGNLSVTGSETLTGNLSATTVTVGGIGLSNGNVIVVGGTMSTSSGNITLTSNSNVVTMNASTGAFAFPVGTSVQRPGTPVNGMSRWNTDVGVYEIWNGTAWQPLTTALNGTFLIVGGGGGGSDAIDTGTVGAGGGAGGYIEQPAGLYVGSYSIVVGAGGTRGAPATSGANSSVVAFSYTAIGGGRGSYNNTGGSDGGSGGGGSKSTANVGGTGGAGTAGQGFAGGAAYSTNAAGGGGGSSQAGIDAIAGDFAGGGGNGTSSTITGTAVTYAGGGGGSGIGFLGLGGSGGGGAGAGNNGSGYIASVAGTNGLGGGGGGGFSSGFPGSNGGSGIVILRYSSATQRATGGNVSNYTSGGNTFWVHTFTTSGTLTVS
jgi:hypothetical protein